jgi:hypothetical protein
MSEYLMQAPVILFIGMAATFAAVLAPIALADLIKNRNA